MVSLEAGRDYILTNWGHDVFLQRKMRGGGWEKDEQGRFVIEKHTVRHNYPANRALPRVLKERIEGLTHEFDFLYYFHEKANPHEGDRVYEINADGRPDKHSTYIIGVALPMRGKGGKIVFWVVGCQRENPQ